jgi:hypothetical protein
MCVGDELHSLWNETVVTSFKLQDLYFIWQIFFVISHRHSLAHVVGQLKHVKSKYFQKIYSKANQTRLNSIYCIELYVST